MVMRELLLSAVIMKIVFGLWRDVAWWTTHVSEERATSIFRVEDYLEDGGNSSSSASTLYQTTLGQVGEGVDFIAASNNNETTTEVNVKLSLCLIN